MAILLIDVSNAPASCAAAWTDSGFREKVKGLALDTYIFDPERRPWDLAAGVIGSLQELPGKCAGESAAQVIILEGSQVHFLPECITKYLQNNLPADYSTQWEHCRLPVGMGCRIISLRSLLVSNAVSPKEHYRYIMTHPGRFSMAYDPNRYVDFKQALLDCRLRQAAGTPDARVSGTPDGTDVKTMEQILTHAAPYRPAENLPPMDERKMPAAYGFESAACAEFPSYIMFDLTNTCNSRCVHCPQSAAFGNRRRKTVHLDFALYKKVIDECAGREIQFVRLTADGEPLLHPDLIPMIEYAVRKGVGPIGLTTNGSLLTPEKAQRLLSSGLFMIDISLDAATDATYAKIRQGLNFTRTLNNIHALISLKEKMAAPMKVMVSFVKQEHNLHEQEAFERYWNSRVDKVLIREMISNVNLTPVPGEDNRHRTGRWPCPHWFRRIVINYEGVIKACPVDWENATAYKSLSETSIYDAWHSDFYWRNRIEHLNGSFSEDAACKGCNDWQGSPWNLGYEKVIQELKVDHDHSGNLPA